eukprot:972601_1
MSDSEVFQLFGTENVSLDAFQQILLQMTSSASAGALSKFFSKNYRPLYQFILRLYLSSLTAQHPDRGRTSKQSEDEYTVKEHKIMAEWANLLTDDEPLNRDDDDDDSDSHDEEDVIVSLPMEVQQLDNATDAANNTEPQAPSSPQISASNTSKTVDTHAQVMEEDSHKKKKKTKKKKKKKKQPQQHSTSQSSFSGLAQFTTAIAMMKSSTKTAYDTYSNAKHKRQHKVHGFEHISHEEKKNSYQANRRHRDSIWSGVLDVNNIIMVPETPKWRPRFSFQQNQLLQEGVLDAILHTISPFKRYQKDDTNKLTLSDEVQVTSVDALCLFLPFVCVVSAKLSSTQSRKELQSIVLQRVMKEVDVKQRFEFFLNSYKNASDLKKEFAAHAQSVSAPSSSSTGVTDSDLYDASVFESVDDLRRSSTNVSTVSSSSNSGGLKAQCIVQNEPESAISLFQSIFRQHLAGGSEIKLCRESRTRDPMTTNAPPLSRIEVRKQIQTASKPYLIDLYVSNRQDNFEYLSSTVILKKGDDLRRDAAILHVSFFCRFVQSTIIGSVIRKQLFIGFNIFCCDQEGQQYSIDRAINKLTILPFQILLCHSFLIQLSPRIIHKHF